MISIGLNLPEIDAKVNDFFGVKFKKGDFLRQKIKRKFLDLKMEMEQVLILPTPLVCWSTFRVLEHFCLEGLEISCGTK